MFDNAEKIFIENGGNMDKDPFWKRVRTEPSYKATIMSQVSDKFRHAMHIHKENDRKLSQSK